MASTNGATASGASPLAFLTKLSPCVYVYRPEPSITGTIEESPTPSPKPLPKLVLLATWMGARDPHIAKYLLQYRAFFPTTPILLVRSEPRHFTRPRGAPRELAPALLVLHSIFPELAAPSKTSSSSSAATSKANPPQLLIHAWSNGGTNSLHVLRLLLTSTTIATPSLDPRCDLPRYTLVLDSTPGAFRYWAAFRTFTTGLSRVVYWLLAPLVHAICLHYWLRHEILGRGKTGPLAAVRKGLNDERLLASGSEVRRTYVYSEGDKLVHWQDVEAHAAEAERKGFVVRREKFDGSEHVAHLRRDATRYWRVVKETWEGEC